MDDTILLYRPLRGRGHQSATFVPKCFDTLRTPRAGLSSSIDTQYRYDKSPTPLSDVGAPEMNRYSPPSPLSDVEVKEEIKFSFAFGQ